MWSEGLWKRDLTSKVFIVQCCRCRTRSLWELCPPRGSFDTEQRSNVFIFCISNEFLMSASVQLQPFPSALRCTAALLRVTHKRDVLWSSEQENRVPSVSLCGWRSLR